jgi:hypothetical protein
MYLKESSFIKYIPVHFVVSFCATLCHDGLIYDNLEYLTRQRYVCSEYFVTL